MPYNSDKHHRRSIRLDGYDYAQVGAYFVTLCVQHRRRLFGVLRDRRMHLSDYGIIADDMWQAVPDHFPHVALDAFVVMPDHVHGIIVIMEPVGAQHAAPLHGDDDGAQHAAPLHGDDTPLRPRVQPGSLGAIVRSYKSAVTQRVNLLCGTPGAILWQRNYYERIIRDEKAFHNIRRYIIDNPRR